MIPTARRFGIFVVGACALAFGMATPTSAAGPATTPIPDAWLAAYRAAHAGQTEEALAALRPTLTDSPDDPWSHFARIAIAASRPTGRAELLRDYRALLARAPDSPIRKLALALALIRTRSRDGSSDLGAPWSVEAAKLLAEVPGQGRSEPWRSLVVAHLAATQNDPAGRRKALAHAWRLHPGHAALAHAWGVLQGRDEKQLAEISLECLAIDPRVIWLLWSGHVPPFDSTATAKGKELIRKLEKLVSKRPEDVDLLHSLRTLLALSQETKRLSDLDRRIAKLDPRWKPPTISLTTAPRQADLRGPLVAQLFAALMKPADQAMPELEALLPATAADPGLEASVRAHLARLLAALPRRDPAAIARHLARALELDRLDDSSRIHFVHAAAESGEQLPRAASAIDALITRLLSGEIDAGPKDAPIPFPTGAVSPTKMLGRAYGARAALRSRAKDLLGARGDLLLATTLAEEDPDLWAERARAEEALGRREAARGAWIEALSRLSDADPRRHFWLDSLRRLLAGILLWATAEDLVTDAREARTTVAPLPSRPAHPLVGKAAPPIDVPKLGGGRINAAAFAGKVLVVDFWATWCKPCLAELEEAEKLRKQWGEDAVVFLALSADSDDDWTNQVPDYVRKHGFGMPVGRSTEDLHSAWRFGDLPSLFVVGRDGVVRRHFEGFGPEDGEEIRKEIAAALEAR